MKKSKNMIELSDQTYENMVDNGLNEQSNSLNRVMKGLAAITVLVLPFNVVSGFMGMNVEVPFRDVDSLLPFFMLLVVASILAVFFYGGFKLLKWL